MMKIGRRGLWEQAWSSSPSLDGSGVWEGASLEGGPLECRVGAVSDADLRVLPQLHGACLEEEEGGGPAGQEEVEEACLCDVMLPEGIKEIEGILDLKLHKPKDNFLQCRKQSV